MRAYYFLIILTGLLVLSGNVPEKPRVQYISVPVTITRPDGTTLVYYQKVKKVAAP